jgi:hypothetical protein
MKKHFLIAILALLVIEVTAQFPVKLPVIISPKFKKDTLSIAKLGAVPNGYFLNTSIINDAITTLHKKGGGVVLVPKGLWLTGPLVLKSNINLHLAVGATLLFTSDKTQYPLVEANWEGLQQMRNQSPISATDAVNIAITGKGIIDGNGDVWRAVKTDKLTTSQWKKLVSSGGVTSDDQKTWYPSEAFMKASSDSPRQRCGVLCRHQRFFAPQYVVAYQL